MPPTPRGFEDHRWMQHALTLAMQMRGHVWPNPPVGCVIVRDGLVIAEGATRPGGRPHAERVALDRAGAAAKGATLYVTLEPCCHWGKTPRCADAIIRAGIARVVCAIQDPDPRVNGGGFRVLRNAGVDLTIGPGAADAASVMSGFFWRMRHRKPEVTVVSEVLDAAPHGLDALMLTSRGSFRVLTHRGEVTKDIQTRQTPSPCLLARMGAFGLTSVAVHRDDPILDEFSPTRRLRARRAGGLGAVAAAESPAPLWKEQ